MFFLLFQNVTYSAPQKEIPALSIQTQSYSHDPETDTFLYQNAKVEWGGISVESTEIRFNPTTQLLKAEGYVRVTEGSIVAVMDELKFNIKEGTGTFINAIIYDEENQAYMTAKKVSRIKQNHYVAENCSFTTCNPKDPAWKIRGSKIDYFGQNFSSSRNTVLEVNGVPVFYFPYLFWPTVTQRQTGFLRPEYSVIRSSLNKFDLGYRIGIPFFWNIDPEQDLTLMYEWIERRGAGFHFDYQYALTEDMRGEIIYQQINERDAHDPQTESGSLSPDDISDDELTPARFKFQFNHNQQLDQQSRWIFSAFVYSDSQFQKEYELIVAPSPNTAQNFSTTLNRQFTKGSITFSATQNRNFTELALLNRETILTEIQYLPLLNMHFNDTLWQSQKSKLTYDINSTIARYYRISGYNGNGVIFTPQFQLQVPVFDGFSGIIKIGKSFSHFQVWDSEITDSNDEYYFEILKGNAELNTSLSKIYSINSGIFSRFKHLITPRLQYDYIEDVVQTSTSGVPFGGTTATRRLATFRLENVLLAKRRYFERSIKLTSRSLEMLRINQISPSLLRKLELIQGKEFGSESLFMDQLDIIANDSIDSELKEIILSFSEKGAIPSVDSPKRKLSKEGKSWTIARLNFIQNYDFFKKDKNFNPIGPANLGNETLAGHPLLPLRTEFVFIPGPAFSLNFFNRYHHQLRQVVEYSVGVGVNTSAHNKASVNLRNNETAYQTPYGTAVAGAKTFGFSNTFETSDKLSFGVTGTVDLDANSSTYKRRLTSNTLIMNYRPDCWSIKFELSEKVGKTTSNSGLEEEYIDRTIYAYIDLGGILLSEQTITD